MALWDALKSLMGIEEQAPLPDDLTPEQRKLLTPPSENLTMGMVPMPGSPASGGGMSPKQFGEMLQRLGSRTPMTPPSSISPTPTPATPPSSSVLQNMLKGVQGASRSQGVANEALKAAQSAGPMAPPPPVPPDGGGGILGLLGRMTSSGPVKALVGTGLAAGGTGFAASALTNMGVQAVTAGQPPEEPSVEKDASLIAKETGVDISDADQLQAAATQLLTQNAPPGMGLQEALSQVQDSTGIDAKQEFKDAHDLLDKGINKGLDKLISLQDEKSEEARQLKQQLENPDEMSFGGKLGLGLLMAIPVIAASIRNRKAGAAMAQSMGQAFSSMEAREAQQRAATQQQANAVFDDLVQVSRSIGDESRAMAAAKSKLAKDAEAFDGEVRQRLSQQATQGDPLVVKLDPKARDNINTMVSLLPQLKQISSLEDSFFEAGGGDTPVISGLWEKLITGTQMSDLGTSIPYLGPLLEFGAAQARSSSGQLYVGQTGRLAQFLAKKVSGGQVTDQDKATEIKANFAALGDTFETVKQKQNMRNNAFNQMVSGLTEPERRSLQKVYIQTQLENKGLLKPEMLIGDTVKIQLPDGRWAGMNIVDYAKKMNAEKSAGVDTEIMLKVQY